MYAIDSSRTIDWTTCGIPGGIPSRASIYTTLNPGVTAAQIQSAISNCPSGQVVQLSAGTYNINGTVAFGSKVGCTLRGAGAGQTIINNATGGACFSSSDIGTGTGVAISSGYTKGSTSIVMSATPSGFTTGYLMVVRQNDVSGLMFGTGGPDAYYSTTHRITGISGTTINFSPPLPYALTAGLSPTAYPVPAQGCSLCGIEDMTINATGTSQDMLNFPYADRCWFKNIEVYNFSNSGVFSYRSVQCEVRRCYIHHANSWPNNGEGYGIYIYTGSTGWLVEDNIITQCFFGMLKSSASAHAVLYNYFWNMGAYGLSWQLPGIDCNHGPHGMMDLYEGNCLEQFQNDGYHGSGSHVTIFRNQIHGLNPSFTANRKGIDLCRASYYHNIVGNIIGDSTWNPASYEVSGSGGGTFVYRFGYPNMGNGGLEAAVPWNSYSLTYPDAQVAATLVRHANYDYFNDAVVYEDGADTYIPDSLIYSSKPSWFGTLTWPAIGPDVTGLVTPTPAAYRWNQYSMSGTLSDLFADAPVESTVQFEAELTVTETEEARLWADYHTVRVVAGTSAVYTVHADAYSGFVADITLDTTGLPENATDAYGTNPIAYNGSTTVTIATAGVAAGTYPLYITGTAVGGTVASVKVVLEVTESADFALKVPVRKIRAKQGDNAVFTVQADAITGFTSDIALDTSQLPEGATATFGDSSLAYNASTTLTIDTTNISVGTHTFYITGS